jgi:hypothetical protein
LYLNFFQVVKGERLKFSDDVPEDFVELITTCVWNGNANIRCGIQQAMIWMDRNVKRLVGGDTTSTYTTTSMRTTSSVRTMAMTSIEQSSERGDKSSRRSNKNSERGDKSTRKSNKNSERGDKSSRRSHKSEIIKLSKKSGRG